MNRIAGNELLRGEKVRLIAFTKETLSGYADWLQYDIEMLRLMNDDLVFPITPADEENWFAEVSSSGHDFIFNIYTLDDNRMLGNCNFHSVDMVTRSAEIGIFIGEPDFRGGGYGTDAMLVLLRFGFMELNLHRAWLSVFSFNGRAIKSYENAGFTHEGSQRQAIRRDGVYHDIVIMSILRYEWQAVNANDE